MAEQTVGQHLDAVLSTLATKADIADLRREIREGDEKTRTDLRAEIRAGDEQTRAELRAEIRAGDEQTRADLRAEIRAGDEQTRAELRAEIRAAIREIVQVVNANTESLREDLSRLGIPVRTTPRGGRG